jgi:hypothetical protein
MRHLFFLGRIAQGPPPPTRPPSPSHTERRPHPRCLSGPNPTHRAQVREQGTLVREREVEGEVP